MKAAAGRGAPGIVMFTPLPPLPNGIADYSAELLRGLGAEIPVTVVVEDGAVEAVAPDGVEVLQGVEYECRAAEFADRLHVYQLGNNPDHVFMLRYMAAQPGLVVLHDPSLHYLLDCATVHAGDIEGYCAALEMEQGEAGRILGEQFRRWGLRETRMYFDLPMLRTMLAGARGAIVHSRFAAVKLLAGLPDLPVTVVPHHYSPPPAQQLRPRGAVRRELGVEASEVLILSLGFATRAKQIDAALRALAMVRDRMPPFRFVVAGEIRPEEIDVAAMARGLGLDDVVVTTGYVAETEFFSLIGAADIVVNLRHPTGGETSGTMIRALGGGAPLVVVERGAFAEIPDDCAVKLRWGAGFDARLAEALLKLAQDPARRARIGANARQHTLAANAMSRSVDGYLSAIRRAEASAPSVRPCDIAWEYLTAHDVARLPARAPLWLRVGTAPCGDGRVRVRRLGDDWGDGDPLHDVLGFSRDESGVAEGEADLAVACWRVGALGDDDAWLVAANRALVQGGLLVVNVRRDSVDAPRHALEMRAAGVALLRRCGFRTEMTAASAEPGLDAADEANEDEARCWRAVKVSGVVARRSA